MKLIPIYSDLFLVNMLSMFELTAEWIRVQNNAQFHCWITGLDNTRILSQLSSGVIPSKIITKNRESYRSAKLHGLFFIRDIKGNHQVTNENLISVPIITSARSS